MDYQELKIVIVVKGVMIIFGGYLCRETEINGKILFSPSGNLFIEDGNNCSRVLKVYTGSSEMHKCFQSKGEKK